MSHPNSVPFVAPRSKQQSPAVRRLHQQAPLRRHVVTYRHGGRTFVRMLAGTSDQVALVDCISGDRLRVETNGQAPSPIQFERMIATKTIVRQVQADTTFLMLLVRSAFGPGFLDQVETIWVRLLVGRTLPWNGRRHSRPGTGAADRRKVSRKR